jgi:hypothetical protein
VNRIIIWQKKGEKEEAIFHKDGNQISEWFDYIKVDGLFEGESDYYIAERNRKYAIFHKDGRQISDWYNKIYLDGLFKGQSDYYIVVPYFYLFEDVFCICKLGSSKCFGPLASVEKFGFIKDPSDNTVTFKTLEDQYKTITKQELDQFFEEKEVEEAR